VLRAADAALSHARGARQVNKCGDAGFFSESPQSATDSLRVTLNHRQKTMRHFAPQYHAASLNRVIAYNGSIEWEELPSLADTLAQRLVNDVKRRQALPHYTSAWDNTLPADLDVLIPAQPFEETLSGLVQREVLEPDVFRHFFGEAAAA
jgi:hypothetical protein